MSKLFGDSHRKLQRAFDTERLADRIEERLCRDHITADDRACIERLDMFFLATADAAGRPNCSYKGGDPGFVRVLDERTLLFPNFDGNGMYLSMGNASENAHVGMLFIDFENQKRLRVNGSAQIVAADSVQPEYPEAQFLVKVLVREVFPNCSWPNARSLCPAPQYPHWCRAGSACTGLATYCRQVTLRGRRKRRREKLAPPAGVEPTTYRLGGGRSIH